MRSVYERAVASSAHEMLKTVLVVLVGLTSSQPLVLHW